MVCSFCRWRGSSGRGTPLLAYCAAPLKPSEAERRRHGSAKLTMPRSAILTVALHRRLRNAQIGGYHAFVAAKLVVHSGNTGSAEANRSWMTPRNCIFR
jgi:hypothetical protein